ncbi:MAG: RNA methyltransferase [Caryophanon sp.]|nr:RNA methyltransferase [Caryophanon sp.]
MTKFLYVYTWQVDEYELVQLEQRSFFGTSSGAGYVLSDVDVAIDRSPFIKTKLTVLASGEALDDIVPFAEQLTYDGETFRVLSLNSAALGDEPKHPFPERQLAERTLGNVIPGEPDLKRADCVFGIVKVDGVWHFGALEKTEPMWLKHQVKPHSYSTALGTRLARALVNIAAPRPEGVTMIDPCCGIGTVLVEALSMDIPILGRDMNWFVAQGSRKNIAHFGYEGTVELGPIEDVTEHYDVAIIDMPYNLFTSASYDEQYAIVKEARRIADRAVFVAIEPMDDMFKEAGFTIVDQANVPKGYFLRLVYVCE